MKDRVALQIVQEALAEGRLRPGGLITEGTAGERHRLQAPLLCSYQVHPQCPAGLGSDWIAKRYGHKQAGIPWVPRRSLFLDPCRALRPSHASAGSTGVSLAMVAAAEGVRCHIAMPDDAALEKSQLLAALGANVQRVPPVSISHPGHFVNVARKVTPHLPEGS